MSLHLLSQCQRAYRQKTGHSTDPDMLTGGVSVLLCWRPEWETLASRPVNRPLETAPDSVNSYFAILLQKVLGRLVGRFCAVFRWRIMWLRPRRLFTLRLWSFAGKSWPPERRRSITYQSISPSALQQTISVLLCLQRCPVPRHGHPE
jgi:hypothetical protein